MEIIISWNLHCTYEQYEYHKGWLGIFCNIKISISWESDYILEKRWQDLFKKLLYMLFKQIESVNVINYLNDILTISDLIYWHFNNVFKNETNLGASISGLTLRLLLLYSIWALAWALLLHFGTSLLFNASESKEHGSRPWDLLPT